MHDTVSNSANLKWLFLIDKFGSGFNVPRDNSERAQKLIPILKESRTHGYSTLTDQTLPLTRRSVLNYWG